ncbi:DASH family cryptochrome [Halothiobacillus neapolitanus]|uniref:Cryptochrome DASH n=1 Tax=Halothiobacillus neapolitanus (strain ATCC 23641 / DSM 15147 / CIP 104769 / NCIMB 8539 / c2) TaxID=555778 RepID=D0L0M2_HALNC|nr:DASH family cryptochrome [Halothiobacillus neapolitanus]ACX96245.1 cryptochrome, DASH family [Halothiobacillus neapolitanus c2]TDN66554.1 deoxyribodipyrimidine photo-lyase [Halothiobacillus neapolitanus]
MSRVLYWFRQDLRLRDNRCFIRACDQADALLPVYILDPAMEQPTRWGFDRIGPHRRVVLGQALRGLDRQLRQRGSGLCLLQGQPVDQLLAMVRQGAIDTVWVEDIAAPQERALVDALKQSLEPLGVSVYTGWQSSLIAPDDLPFAIDRLPDSFTPFRKRVEQAAVCIEHPYPAPDAVPPWPESVPYPTASIDAQFDALCGASTRPAVDARSAFPCDDPDCSVDEIGAQRHLDQYFARGLPHTYKATRNQLIGKDYSSKWSPFLALGVLSARQVYAARQHFEQARGANEGTYWLRFELLWRDYFRFLHLKYGRRLYHARGLAPDRPAPTHDADRFERWKNADTGHAFIDAAMTELSRTGYLSNRMRQVVASYLIHDLGCDWRAGAAWFESQLVDYDVYSNQGNWLYLAGYGTDPRGSRRFNPDKQAQDYDPGGAYRALWLSGTAAMPA